MTPLALTLMITSMGLVTALEIYCLWRLLSPRRGEPPDDPAQADDIAGADAGAG